MDKIVVTALLLIAGVISAITIFNNMFPLINQSTDAMGSMERREDDRMNTQIQIVHAAQSNGNIVIWIKNVGSARIIGVDSSDFFFGPQSNYVRLPFGSGAPHWGYGIENGGVDWNPATTINVTIYGYGVPAPGRYFVKFVLSNGVSDEAFFSW